jgi:hypothetical protein
VEIADIEGEEKQGRTKRVKFFGPSSHGVIVVLERGEEKGIEQEVFPPFPGRIQIDERRKKWLKYK